MQFAIMAFIRVQDYYIRISAANLNQILGQAQQITGDTEVRYGSELTAIAYARGKLTQRFKVDKIFTDIMMFSAAAPYKWGDLIDLEAAAYSNIIVYNANEFILYTDGNIYYKNSETSGYAAGILPIDDAYFTLVGAPSLYYVTPPPTFDEDTFYTPGQFTVYNYEYYVRTANTDGYKVDGYRENQQSSLFDEWADVPFVGGTIFGSPYANPGADVYGNLMTPQNQQYWKKIIDFTPYQITGVWPSDATKWTHGDNRNQLIVKAVIDMALLEVHGVINPNQVPALRWNRDKEAKDWLSMCADGTFVLECPFYTEDKNRGMAMRSGSNPATGHSY